MSLFIWVATSTLGAHINIYQDSGVSDSPDFGIIQIVSYQFKSNETTSNLWNVYKKCLHTLILCPYPPGGFGKLHLSEFLDLLENLEPINRLVKFENETVEGISTDVI